MRQYLNRIYLLLLCLLFGVVDTPLNAQEAPRRIDTAWQRLVNDKELTYKNTLEVQQAPVKEDKGILTTIMAAIAVFFMSTAGKTILWILVISLMSYIVYLVIKDRTILFKRKKRYLQQEQDYTEGDINETNWGTLLSEAEAKSDRRLIIRYSYMLLLKLLQDAQLIQYRDDKTNYDYYNELSNSKYRQDYKNLSQLYEYAWYGNYQLSDEAYLCYIGTFNKLRQELSIL